MKMTSTTLRGKNRIFGKAIAVLAVSFGALAFAQQRGSFGFNTVTPKATMEINVATENASGTTVEGIVIPNVTTARVTAMGTNPKESTLVYITDGVAGTGTTSNVSGKGFYYYDTATSKWVKVGAGSGSGTTLPNGTANGQVLTWDAGTSSWVPRIYTVSPVVESFSAASHTISNNTTFAIFTPETGTSVVSLGTSSVNGRNVCIWNNSADSNMSFDVTPPGQHGVIFPKTGVCYTYYNGTWYSTSAY